MNAHHQPPGIRTGDEALQILPQGDEKFRQTAWWLVQRSWEQKRFGERGWEIFLISPPPISTLKSARPLDELTVW